MMANFKNNDAAIADIVGGLDTAHNNVVANDRAEKLAQDASVAKQAAWIAQNKIDVAKDLALKDILVATNTSSYVGISSKDTPEVVKAIKSGLVSPQERNSDIVGGAIQSHLIQVAYAKWHLMRVPGTQEDIEKVTNAYNDLTENEKKSVDKLTGTTTHPGILDRHSQNGSFVSHLHEIVHDISHQENMANVYTSGQKAFYNPEFKNYVLATEGWRGQVNHIFAVGLITPTDQPSLVQQAQTQPSVTPPKPASVKTPPQVAAASPPHVHNSGKGKPAAPATQTADVHSAGTHGSGAQHPPASHQPDATNKINVKYENGSGSGTFAYNSVELTKEDKAALDALVSQSAGKTIDLAGHATGQGKYNESLALRRAETAKAYLIEKGVDAKNITTHGAADGSRSVGFSVSDRPALTVADASASRTDGNVFKAVYRGWSDLKVEQSKVEQSLAAPPPAVAPPVAPPASQPTGLVTPLNQAQGTLGSNPNNARNKLNPFKSMLPTA